MRRWLSIALVLILLAAAAWAWPFFGAAELASAAQRGDTTSVIERTDLAALRRSLARQIAQAYLKATGKAQKLSGLSLGLAGAAATTVADPYVAELLTAENITALIGQGKIGAVTLGKQSVAVTRRLPNIPDLFRADIWSAVTGASFDGIASFVIPVTQAGSDDTYAIHLRLDGLTWRLSGLDLPPPVIDEMAQALLKSGTSSAP